MKAKAKKPRRIRRQLAFVQLEARLLFTSFNVPWPEAYDLTLSFAPDGTSGIQPSALFKTLDQQMPTAQWQQEVLRAFQTWAIETNVNVGLVADGGQPFGALGLKQGDPRFGDIRIGAFPMAPDTLAIADPYDPFVANTWVGDVFLNSAVTFGATGQRPGYDLFSVLLHEAGHALGIGHNPDPNSPMFEQFRHASDVLLAPADASAIQALYGARAPDQFDARAANDTFASAVPISATNTSGQFGNSVAGDITTLADADIYRLVAPAGVQALDINIVAAGVSLLVPRLTIFNAAGEEIATCASPDPLHNNLSLSLRRFSPGDVFYVKVESGRDDVFGIGGYRLQIAPHADSSHAADLPKISSIDAGGSGSVDPSGNSLAGAHLLATTPGYVEHTYYEIYGSLSPTTPAQTYRVRSADLGPDMTNVMTVLIASPAGSRANLQTAVLDDQGRLVNATVLENTAGQLEIQISSVQSNRDYFVELRGSEFGNQAVEYELTVDFDQDAAHLQTFVNDSLSRAQPEVVRTLQVVQSQQFHFVLSASDWNHPAETSVEMTIVDSQGRTVFALGAANGATRGQDVFLDRGQYAVRFSMVGSSLDVPTTFQLSGLSTSESLGPQLRDTTLQAVDAPADAALSNLAFYWLPPGPDGWAYATANGTLHVDAAAPGSEDAGPKSAATSASLKFASAPQRVGEDAGRAIGPVQAPVLPLSLLLARDATSAPLPEQPSPNALAAPRPLTVRANRELRRSGKVERATNSLESILESGRRVRKTDVLSSGANELPAVEPSKRHLSSTPVFEQKKFAIATPESRLKELLGEQGPGSITARVDFWGLGVCAAVLGYVIRSRATPDESRAALHRLIAPLRRRNPTRAISTVEP